MFCMGSSPILIGGGGGGGEENRLIGGMSTLELVILFPVMATLNILIISPNINPGG